MTIKLIVKFSIEGQVKPRAGKARGMLAVHSRALKLGLGWETVHKGRRWGSTDASNILICTIGGGIYLSFINEVGRRRIYQVGRAL